MTIHVFIAHMGLGGAERVCVNLADEWYDKGCEVHIVTLNLEGDINTVNLKEGIQVHELGVKRLRYAMIPMYRYIRRYRPDFMLIFGNEMAIILQKLRMLRLIDTKLIVRVLNNVNISLSKEDGISPVVENYLRSAQKTLLKMDHIVAQCMAMGKQLTDRGLVYEDRLSVIYNPVSKELTDRVTGLRRDRQTADGIKEIVFIGRIDPQKNPLELLRAYAAVKENRPKTRLRFVGDGILSQAVRDEAVRLGLETGKDVILDGVRTDMDNVYARADVIVLSSDYEGMPNCLIEAIGCGVPVVSYDCPMGPSEIVVDGVNGYLIPMGNTGALTEGMIEALDREWDSRAVTATCEKFKSDHIADKYMEIFARYE